MAAAKKSKTQPSLRQSTLPFTSKRVHSSKFNEKKKAPIRQTGSAPVPAPVQEEQVQVKRPRSPDPLEISSDSETETETDRPTSENVKPTPPTVEEVERERLNPRDRKWNKHYAIVKATMGGLPAGEQSSFMIRCPAATSHADGSSPWGETDEDTRDPESVRFVRPSDVPLMFVTLNLNLLACSRSYKYGPCIGTTRMERWKRAKALGLNPPVEVCRIIIA